MASLDLHNRPFDEGTIRKLDLFEKYTQEWIPTFLFDGRPRELCIFDFFAGPGYDSNHIAGSPIRILQKLQEQAERLRSSGVTVRVFLNERDPSKFTLLQASTSEFLENAVEVGKNVVVETLNLDFRECFPKLRPIIRDSQSLVFLDQNGIEFLNSVFDLTESERTDFMVFVASSYVWRFADEFKPKLQIDLDELKANPYRFIHRTLTNVLRKRLRPGSRFQIYPFSLRKGANIYGLIFGAAHPLAVAKFLRLVWRSNPVNGEANFDIDDDDAKRQGHLFDTPKLTKIQSFQREVERAVLKGEVKNNRELFDFVLRAGHLGQHAHKTLISLRQQGLISFKGPSPCITYEKTYNRRKQHLVEYKVILQ